MLVLVGGVSDGDRRRVLFRVRARLLVRRKLRGTRRLDPQVRIRRLAGMLGRKGYPPEVALRVVREEVGADEAAEVPLDEVID